MFLLFDFRPDEHVGKLIDHDVPFLRAPGGSHHHGGSFGKASISSGFSIRTNSSDRDSQIDTLMKTIAKDPSPSLHGVELNDASSFKITINKTSELETNNDTLKKLAVSATPEKPNNQIKLSNAAITPLPPGQIKCNILKGLCASSHGEGGRTNFGSDFSTRRRRTAPQTDQSSAVRTKSTAARWTGLDERGHVCVGGKYAQVLHGHTICLNVACTTKF